MNKLESDNYTRIEIELYFSNDRHPGMSFANKVVEKIAKDQDILIGSNPEGYEFVQVRSVETRIPEEKK